MRLSTILSAVSVMLIVAQWLPVIGLISWFGAAHLAGLVLNLAILVLIVEGALGVAPRSYALAALALIGFYVAAAALSKRQAAHFTDGLRAANAIARVAWSSATTDLLLVNSLDDEMRGSRLNARAMIGEYGLDQLFAQREQSPDPVRGIQARAGPCPSGATMDERLRRSEQNGWCFIPIEGGPSRPTLRIESGRALNRSAGLIRIQQQQIVLRSPDGIQVVVQAGGAAALPWLPWPVLGVEWSGGGSYRSRAAFRLAREGREASKRRIDALDVTATALGLAPRKAGLR